MKRELWPAARKEVTSVAEKRTQTEIVARMRDAVAICAKARQDIQTTLGNDLDNQTYYAVLGRIDALSADIARFVGDTLAAAR